MREAYITIHHALHSDADVVILQEKDYPILKASNGCRYVTFEGVKIMEQNKHKTSTYSARARAGEKITWVMTEPSWILIDDATIRSFSNKQRAQPKTADNVPKGQFQSTTAGPVSKRIAGAGDYRVTRNFWRQK